MKISHDELQYQGKELFLYVSLGETEKVKEILENNPNIALIINDYKNTNEYGATSLHEACYKGHTEILGLLLSIEGIDVNICDDCGNTPLHMAAANKQADAAKLLLKKEDVKIDTKNTARNTPLHKAAMYGNEEMVTLLFEYGVKADIKNSDGKTAKSLARENGYTELAKTISEYANIPLPDVKSAYQTSSTFVEQVKNQNNHLGK